MKNTILRNNKKFGKTELVEKSEKPINAKKLQ